MTPPQAQLKITSTCAATPQVVVVSKLQLSRPRAQILAQELPSGVMPQTEAKGEAIPPRVAVANSRAATRPPFGSRPITVLCAARSSVYQSFPGVTIYTRTKDAWNANCPGPVVAHPPCRCWSRAWALSSLTIFDRVSEMLLGMECVRLTLKHGGVLEQPAHSRLWAAANLPVPGEHFPNLPVWSLAVDQAEFGHRTSKPTWLLFAGIHPGQVLFDEWRLAQMHTRRQARLTPGQRSATPLPFARFLLRSASFSTPFERD